MPNQDDFPMDESEVSNFCSQCGMNECKCEEKFSKFEKERSMQKQSQPIQRRDTEFNESPNMGVSNKRTQGKIRDS